MTEKIIYKKEFANNTDCGGVVVLKLINNEKIMLIDSGGCWSGNVNVVVIDLKNKKATKYMWYDGSVWKENYAENELKTADEIEEIDLS